MRSSELQGRMRIPVAEFSAVGQRAERVHLESPDIQFYAGVWATIKWIGGWGTRPLFGVGMPATPLAIWQEGVLAQHISKGFRYPGPEITKDFASGVAMTVW